MEFLFCFFIHWTIEFQKLVILIIFKLLLLLIEIILLKTIIAYFTMDSSFPIGLFFIVFY